MDFADWLKEQLRARSDLNQARLADQLGVYASTVHYWMKGRSIPDDANVGRLAEIFGTEPAAIYRVLGKLPPSKIDNIEPTFDEMEILSDLVELRSERVYSATVVAMKALLMVAKHEADSPFPDPDD